MLVASSVMMLAVRSWPGSTVSCAFAAEMARVATPDESRTLRCRSQLASRLSPRRRIRSGLA